MAEEKKEKYFTSLEKWLVIIGALAFVIVTISYAMNFQGKLSSSSDEWANLGTYFSGLLSPIISFCALVGIVYALRNSRETLKLSKKELKETRRELRRARRAQQKQLKLANQQGKYNILLTADKELDFYKRKVFEEFQGKTLEQIAVTQEFYSDSYKRELDFAISQIQCIAMLGLFYELVIEYSSKAQDKEFFQILYIKHIDLLKKITSFYEKFKSAFKMEPKLSKGLEKLAKLKSRLDGVFND